MPVPGATPMPERRPSHFIDVSSRCSADIAETANCRTAALQISSISSNPRNPNPQSAIRNPQSAIDNRSSLDVSFNPVLRIHGRHPPLDPRRPVGAGRHHARSAAVAARGAGTDGVRAVQRAAAAAVDREPAPQGARRQRLGDLARRGHQPALLDGAGQPPGNRATAVAAGARTGDRQPRGRAGPSAAADRAGGAPDRDRRSSSRRRSASGTGCARSCSARISMCRRRAACWTRRGWSATWAAAPAR